MQGLVRNRKVMGCEVTPLRTSGAGPLRTRLLVLHKCIILTEGVDVLGVEMTDELLDSVQVNGPLLGQFCPCSSLARKVKSARLEELGAPLFPIATRRPSIDLLIDRVL